MSPLFPPRKPRKPRRLRRRLAYALAGLLAAACLVEDVRWYHDPIGYLVNVDLRGGPWVLWAGFYPAYGCAAGGVGWDPAAGGGCRTYGVGLSLSSGPYKVNQ